jgi:hypothetical protein
MKLSKKDRSTLEGIFSTLTRGHEYLMGGDVVVTRRKRMATTTTDFTSPSGECITPICKEIGTELVLIETALTKLRDALFVA